jgi:SAM-dependent methyltransferase
MISKATHFVQILISHIVSAGDFVVDATCGNGFDTLFLSDAVGEQGRVLALDVQDLAIDRTRERLGRGRENVTLLKRSHDELEAILKDHSWSSPRLVLFNLGYLPGGDQDFVTSAATTIPALRQALSVLARDGTVIAVLYTGHSGGLEEAETVVEWALDLDPKQYSVSKHQWLNHTGMAPFVLTIQPRT